MSLGRTWEFGHDCMDGYTALFGHLVPNTTHIHTPTVFQRPLTSGRRTVHALLTPLHFHRPVVASTHTHTNNMRCVSFVVAAMATAAVVVPTNAISAAQAGCTMLGENSEVLDCSAKQTQGSLTSVRAQHSPCHAHCDTRVAFVCTHTSPTFPLPSNSCNFSLPSTFPVDYVFTQQIHTHHVNI